MIACKTAKNVQSLVQFISNSFLMVGQMMNKNTSLTSLIILTELQFQHFRSQMSFIRFNFQNNHGNPSSGAYIPQSVQVNSDTIFRGSHWSCSSEVFLKILQNSQKNTCVGVSFLIKLKGLMTITLLKKRFRHRCVFFQFPKFLRTHFLQNTSGKLVLYSIAGRKTYSSL